MTYQTNSANNQHELLDSMRLFCIANDWTEQLWIEEIDGKRLHLQKGGMIANFKSTSGQKLFNVTTQGIGINLSEDFDPALNWDKQPGVPISIEPTPRPLGARLHRIESNIPIYHLFAFDHPYMIVMVCEYQIGKYQWLMFGESKKLCNFNGGMFFAARWG